MDDISCWLPDLRQFSEFGSYDAATYRCPISEISPRRDPEMSWVLLLPCAIPRLIAAGPAFELFNACNRHINPDKRLLDPFLSRFAAIEATDTKSMHRAILEYQIHNISPDTSTGRKWQAALHEMLATLTG